MAALNPPQDSRESFLATLERDGDILKATRPTAVNLEWGVNRQLEAIAAGESIQDMVAIARQHDVPVILVNPPYNRRIFLG